ncbi:glycosyltransferase family 2 protein [Candidatus Saccharibacteria bacterium]|nr:glycosyltransferase family 2 protein [Candidatus Saccharibacteria bacterium]
MKAKISVLVPIYNVEEYLPECLDSLIVQTLKELEIICINDGSTDSCPDILKEYAEKDSRIVIINKKNSGYGDSMNKGLKKATGEYIGIVESDDFMSADGFEKMYRLAEKHKVEVVKSNFYEYFTDKYDDVAKRNLFRKEDVNRVVDPRKDRAVIYEQPSIWSAIYRRDFLEKNDIKFLPSPGASYQDAGFNFKVWACARKAYFTDEAFLHYRQDNPSSSMKSSGKIFAVKNEYDEVESYLKNHNLYEEYKYTLVAMRLSSYAWNINRLTNSAAREFIQEAKKDYARMKAEGLFDKDKLDGVGLYNVRRMENSHPEIFLAFRPIFNSSENLKRKIKGFVKKLKTGRSSSSELAASVEELQKKQAEIEEKVNRLLDTEKK